MSSVSVNVTDYRKQIPGHLDESRLTWYFPVINSINANNRKIFWQIKVRLFAASPVTPTEKSDQFAPILDEYFDSKPIPFYGWCKVDSGVVGGKTRDSSVTVVASGKNLGRKNATNAFTQALRDSYGKYLKQVNKASEPTVASVQLYPPMLASLYSAPPQGSSPQGSSPQGSSPQGSSLDFQKPVYVQRKYDGIRAVATYEIGSVRDDLGNPVPFVIFYSRSKKIFQGFNYIREQLVTGLREMHQRGIQLYLDGEMYKYGMPLQDISGYARREDKPVDIRVDFMVYDVFIPDKPDMLYSERKAILEQFFQEFGPFESVKPVETFTAEDEQTIKKLYARFLEEGYEGAIIRPDTPYVYSKAGYRGKNLLKLKPTLDAEFKIVGYETGAKGKASEALMFVCETDSGIQFSVTPAMELQERIQLAKRMAEPSPQDPHHTLFETDYLGKQLIVMFDEWSRDRVPQRARTKGVIRTWA